MIAIGKNNEICKVCHKTEIDTLIVNSDIFTVAEYLTMRERWDKEGICVMCQIKEIDTKKKFRVRWAEEHYYLAEFEAKDLDDAKEKVAKGYQEDFILSDKSQYVDNTIEIEEVIKDDETRKQKD